MDLATEITQNHGAYLPFLALWPLPEVAEEVLPPRPWESAHPPPACHTSNDLQGPFLKQNRCPPPCNQPLRPSYVAL